MAGNVKRKIAEFYRRQQFRFQNRKQIIRVAIRGTRETKGLSLCFATLCVVDLFGVFPIIALPAALINCGKASHDRSLFLIHHNSFVAEKWN